MVAQGGDDADGPPAVDGAADARPVAQPGVYGADDGAGGDEGEDDALGDEDLDVGEAKHR